MNVYELSAVVILVISAPFAAFAYGEATIEKLVPAGLWIIAGILLGLGFAQ